MNDPLSAITIDAFLVALAQLESPLPATLQSRLNSMAGSVNAELLDIMAEEYPPLNALYQEAREVFQDYDSERSKGPIPAKPDEKAESQTGEETNDVFQSRDSVETAKSMSKETGVLNRLIKLVKQSRV